MKELTKAEEQVMQELWAIRKGFVKDILDNLPEPKPAYNTVSTVVRILEKKGFVAHVPYGKTHEYFPLISRDDYRKQLTKGLVKNYFAGSFAQLVSFFTSGRDVPLSELEELRQMMERKIKKSKKE
jgi:predicted transcriptional regulator